jgi:hypothetical protein
MVRFAALILVAACHPSGSIPVGGGDADTDTDSDADADADTDTPTTIPSDALAITRHPDVATILVVDWEQSAHADEVWLAWTFEDVAHTSPVLARDAGPQEEVVLGLPPSATVDVTLHERVDGVDHTIGTGSGTTGKLPNGLPPPRLVSSDPTQMRTEPYLLTSVNSGAANFFGPCYTVILDAQGRIVWYRLTSGSRLTVGPKVARNGGYLLIDETAIYVGGDATLTRTTLDMHQRETVKIPRWFIAFDELDDHSILFDESVSAYQFYLTRQYPDGHQERIWDCNQWMDPFAHGYWDCATNTVLYDPVENTVLWSTFDTSTIVAIDLDSGAIVHEFGQYPGGTDFEPREAMVELQHNPGWSADRTLVVSTHVPDEPNVQMAREFSYDPVGDTLTEIWSHQADKYAEYEGQAQKIPNGNYLWELGTAGEIVEITPAEDEVWKIDWNDHLTGTATLISDLYALDAGW